MALETIIKIAFEESINGKRQGDKIDELKAIQSYIKSCQKIGVPNHDHVKTTVINPVLESFGLAPAENLQIHTSSADLTRMPAVTKALMALDLYDLEMVIARGRLGVPGSGSLLILMDNKGRILSAATSPPHILHHKNLKDAVRDEMIYALERIGLKVLK